MEVLLAASIRWSGFRRIGEARNLTDDRDERDQLDKQSEDLNRDGDRYRGPVGRWLNSLASIGIGRGHPEHPRQGAQGNPQAGSQIGVNACAGRH
jgi:hypothetical protein